MIKSFAHKGLKDFWAVTVNGNWRVIFYFEGHDAYLVDYLDYH
ncbi:MAG: type II toxin-antitoxin system RelE/ParE family toxin [Lachnospiraceae bacterium]|nr:type II toxin-antitoxin system RelE/ParE family toxin [Lachnospiraceae bacterium]